MIYSYQGVIPVIHESSYVHPQATIIGQVTIGAKVFVGAGAVLRGDMGEIILMDGCNVQDNCVLHMFPGIRVLVHEDAHIGHGAIIHGAELGRNCLIGMNAVIMDDVVVGEEAIIGAQSFVKSKMKIPRRKLVVGNPAKIVKDVSDEMIYWKSRGTAIYQSLPAKYQDSCKVVEALRDPSAQLKLNREDYMIWKDTQTDAS